MAKKKKKKSDHRRRLLKLEIERGQKERDEDKNSNRSSLHESSLEIFSRKEEFIERMGGELRKKLPFVLD